MRRRITAISLKKIAIWLKVFALPKLTDNTSTGRSHRTSQTAAARRAPATVALA
jgi:hypothetical protein